MEMKNLPWFVGPAALEAYTNPTQYVVLDYETTNINKGAALEESNEIVLACWFVVTPEGITQKHHWGNQYEQSELEKDVKESQFVVAHNAKFELQWLKRSGLELHDILVFDTMLGEWVIGGNRWKLQDLSLEETSHRYGFGDKESVASYLIKKGVCPSVIPREWLLPYCYRDIELTYYIFQEQVERLSKDGLLHLALTRNLCCAALADMEFNPCQLDAEKVDEVYRSSIAEFQELDGKLHALTGGVNMGSPVQVRKYLYEVLNFSPPINPRTKEPFKTDTGLLSTAQDVLEKLESSTKEQDEFLSLFVRRNELDALLSKNLFFFKAICDEMGGEFYGKFNQCTVGTHRLSSSGFQVKLDAFKEPKAPQLQNLPRALKYLFTAHDEDEVVVEMDGSQLEFRVAADESRDPTAQEEIVNGVDIHQFTMQTLLDNKDPEMLALPPEDRRQESKKHTFRPLFGGGSGSKALVAYCNFFKEKYAKLSETQYNWALKCASQGWFRTVYGMKFYFPGTRMQQSGYITNSTMIYNYPIQGFATGEIIPIALVCFWHRTRGMPITLWNTVHDSLAVRVKKAFVDVCKAIGKQAMTYDVYKYLDDVYNYSFDFVPLGLGVKVAKNWGYTKQEESWDVFYDGTEKYKIKG